MKVNVVDNKRYQLYNVSEDPSIFDGYYEGYEVDIDIRKKLAKDLGFSYELYTTLVSIDRSASAALVNSMSKQTSHPEITLLLDEESRVVVGYSLEKDRFPLLNKDFIYRVNSLADTSDAVKISEIYYHKDDKLSSIILKKEEPIIIEEKYEGRDSVLVEYEIGVLLVNDELNNTYSRLVLYVDNQPLYLPSSYYNTTTSRYKRSTGSSVEALEVLILKVIDDLREDYIKNKLYDFHFRYRANKHILASYEEYNSVLNTMRKIPTIIEDNSFLESLLSQYENFERKYIHLEDKKSSYIWRCTALSDITVGALVSMASKILNDVGAPAMEYFFIRDLLGTYISTNRIAEEIADENLK